MALAGQRAMLVVLTGFPTRRPSTPTRAPSAKWRLALPARSPTCGCSALLFESRSPIGRSVSVRVIRQENLLELVLSPLELDV